MSLTRTVEQWRTCEPKAMACLSLDQNEQLLRDARHDILALTDALRTLHTVCVGRSSPDAYQAAIAAAAILTLGSTP